MKRILATALGVLVVGAFVVVATGASNGGGSAAGTYKIELDNAFGLVPGEDFKVAGVVAGSIKSIDLDRKTLRSIVTVQVGSARIRVVPLGRLLPVAPAVADRRVLHQLRPRNLVEGAAVRVDDPGDADVLDDPRRPAPGHHADAVPGAPDGADQ